MKRVIIEQLHTLYSNNYPYLPERPTSFRYYKYISSRVNTIFSKNKRPKDFSSKLLPHVQHMRFVRGFYVSSKQIGRNCLNGSYFALPADIWSPKIEENLNQIYMRDDHFGWFCWLNRFIYTSIYISPSPNEPETVRALPIRMHVRCVCVYLRHRSFHIS